MRPEWHCPLLICDGTGWILVDHRPDERERCPCNPGNLPEPAEVDRVGAHIQEQLHERTF